jgi:hypothetical protein
MSETARADRAKVTEELEPGESSKAPVATSEAIQEAVRRVLPSMIEENVRRVLPSVFEERVRELMPSLVEDLAQEYGLSTEVAGLLHLLGSKSDDSHEDLLSKGAHAL